MKRTRVRHRSWTVRPRARRAGAERKEPRRVERSARGGRPRANTSGPRKGHVGSDKSVGPGGGPGRKPRRTRRPRPRHPLPTPARTPFTFGYALVLVLTSLFAEYADPDLVSRVLRGSSTDVVHLAQAPVPVLAASALWIAGGILSAFAVAFLLVLTALERRIGGLRTAGVFLLGHGVATLATEIPVGVSVLLGHLPASSLHRYDYGISFGVAASAGALAGLLTPWPRLLLLAVSAWLVGEGLVAFTDPLTDWGHLLALATGIATWPWVRRAHRARDRSQRTAPGEQSAAHVH
ncbi:rhomboid-like protein [Streptomyces sp. NPDC102365]|uniref:rhomboid-like protein n=1 Tax=Streptomyces sp. NPDC102365 TaxID=3366162 RepID=UPI00380964D3